MKDLGPCSIHYKGRMYECEAEHTDGKRYKHCTVSSYHNEEITTK